MEMCSKSRQFLLKGYLQANREHNSNYIETSIGFGGVRLGPGGLKMP